MKILIAYDGECPFCKSYIHHIRLKNNATDVQLINIRQRIDLIEMLRTKNINPNQGIYITIDNQAYYAADALNALALITTPHNIFNKINIWIFKNSTRARFFYPILKAGRFIVLKILRQPMIPFDP